MIPQGLYDPARAEALRRWLVDELRRAMQDRQLLEHKWEHWAAAYRCQPAEENKTFPFEGCANLVVPVIATDVDTMFARFVGLIMEPKHLWSIEPTRPEFVNAAPRIEEFLGWAQANELKLYDPIANWVLETAKLGTGILKQRYTRDQRKVFEWRELQQGVFQQQSIVMMKDSPSVHHVRLHDFYVPAGYQDLQLMPWCAEKISLNWSQFTNRVQAGIYQADQKLGEWSAKNNRGQLQQSLDAISHYQASYGTFMNLFEFWTDFDIDGDGYDEALLCTIHLDSESYVRLDFNPFFHQEKPYSVARYMRDGNSFYGIGLCEMGDDTQEEVTAMHNQRIDNATINNTSVFAASADETTIEDGTPIWAGRVFKLNRPDMFKSVAMGNKYDSTIQNERETLAYASRRTGVNDYITGQNSPDIGYGTAYTTQQMIASSTRRTGESLRDFQVALGETGTRVLEMYQQFNQRGKAFYAMGPQDGAMVEMVLQFPLDLIRKGLRVSVTAMDPASSKDARIKNNTMALQMLMMFYQQYLQGLGYLANPQIPPIMKQVIQQMLEGASTLMRRLLDDYGYQDNDALVPDLQDAITRQQQQLELVRSALINGTAANFGAQGAPGLTGMGGPFGNGGAAPQGFGGGAPQQQGIPGYPPGAGPFGGAPQGAGVPIAGNSPTFQ
jgi:hypothetical protein